MKRLLLIVLPLLLVVGCSKEYDRYDIVYNQGTKTYYEKFSEKPVNGKVFKKFGDKKVLMGKLKDGKEHGLYTEWHKNGQKKSEGTFKDGEKDGLHTKWYENGQKVNEINYKDGERDGLQTSWYENGNKAQEGHNRDGKSQGDWIQFYENGKKERVLYYKDDEIIDITEWNEDGSPRLYLEF